MCCFYRILLQNNMMKFSVLCIWFFGHGNRSFKKIISVLHQCFPSTAECLGTPNFPGAPGFHATAPDQLHSPSRKSVVFHCSRRPWPCVPSEQPCVITQLHKSPSPLPKSFIGPGLCTDLYTPHTTLLRTESSAWRRAEKSSDGL